VAGNEGLARPVFDIDSIGLISLLNKMNKGLAPRRPTASGCNWKRRSSAWAR